MNGDGVAAARDALMAVEDIRDDSDKWVRSIAAQLIRDDPDLAVGVIAELVAMVGYTDRQNNRLRARLERAKVQQTPPRPREPRRRGSTNAARDAAIADRVNEGLTLQAVGAEFGITRERVRQITKREGVIVGQTRQIRRAAEQARAAADAEAACQATCEICGKPFRRRRKVQRTCGGDCYLIITEGRRYLSPEKYETQRRAHALSVLRHPTSHRPSEVERAKRILDGTAPPPNRRYIRPGSKIEQALRRVGREDLMPAVANGKHRNEYPCAATNLNGQPCSRTVPLEGGLCHIHTGAVGRARWSA